MHTIYELTEAERETMKKLVDMGLVVTIGDHGRLKERVTMLRAALEGCRGMAGIEVSNGSRTWAKAMPLIDEALAYPAKAAA